MRLRRMSMKDRIMCGFCLAYISMMAFVFIKLAIVIGKAVMGGA